MKGIYCLTSSVLTMALVLASPIALADEVAVVSSTTDTSEIQPISLVHRAYSGHFSNQGIPGFNSLTIAYENGQIEAEDLVQTAINQGRLSPDKLSDEGYLETVRFQLRQLEDRH